MSQLSPQTRHGRPPKFGRPAQLVTLTLPQDVVAWLESVDADLGWAVVKLFERAVREARTIERPVVELAVVDRLDAAGVSAAQREALTEFRQRLKVWRQEGVRFESRSILVAERNALGQSEPLSQIDEVRNGRRRRGVRR